ncbi:MAG: 4Fe-4S dicluster domain-containing protein [Alicyclobacillus sp.]|nr:4Fe-4S dicluster domain-containing protein [Alicyclobacillus sp.]
MAELRADRSAAAAPVEALAGGTLPTSHPLPAEQGSEGLYRFTDKLDVDELTNCMRCGFCLPACPTYRETGLEFASPRGRIALMKGVAAGQVDVNQAFDEAMYLCLGCRACETACPAGVKYGHLVEGARELIESERERVPWVRMVRWLTMDALFPYPRRMRWLGELLAFAQRTGLDGLAERLGLMRALPKSLAEMHKALPPVAGAAQRRSRRKVVPAAGGARLRVGLLTGCVMDAVFFETNENTARVLAAAGCEVVYVPGQTCCGALHAHSGDKDAAKELAKRNIEAFEQAGVDVYVNNAGGCGAALKDYAHWFRGDAEWEARARRFSERMKDFNELLAELELPPMRPLPYRVTYQDSCHLAHGQGVRRQPRELLRRIPGIRYVEMAGADSPSSNRSDVAGRDRWRSPLEMRTATVVRT